MKLSATKIDPVLTEQGDRIENIHQHQGARTRFSRSSGCPIQFRRIWNAATRASGRGLATMSASSRRRSGCRWPSTTFSSIG